MTVVSATVSAFFIAVLYSIGTGWTCFARASTVNAFLPFTLVAVIAAHHPAIAWVAVAPASSRMATRWGHCRTVHRVYDVTDGVC